MIRTPTLLVLACLVLASSVLVAPLGAVVAQQTTPATASIDAASTDPGVSTTHIVIVPIDENTTGDVRGLRIDYGEADVDTSEINDNRIEAFGIDRDGDEADDRVDVQLDDDIADIDSLDDGRVLSLRVHGGRLARPGDEVVLSYRIENPPDVGMYPVNVTYNPRTNATEYTAMLRIGDAPTTAEPEPTPTFTPSPTATLEPTPTATATASPTPMATPEPTPSPTAVATGETATETMETPATTETESPGFGVVVALAALGALVTLAVGLGFARSQTRRREGR